MSQCAPCSKISSIVKDLPVYRAGLLAAGEGELSIEIDVVYAIYTRIYMPRKHMLIISVPQYL